METQGSFELLVLTSSLTTKKSPLMVERKPQGKELHFVIISQYKNISCRRLFNKLKEVCKVKILVINPPGKQQKGMGQEVTVVGHI